MKNKNKKLRFKLKLKNFGLTILKIIVLLITVFACFASIWFVSDISVFLSVISGMLSVFGYNLLIGKIENIKINNKHSINKLKINEWPMYNYNDPIFKELEDKPKQKVLK